MNRSKLMIAACMIGAFGAGATLRGGVNPAHAQGADAEQIAEAPGPDYPHHPPAPGGHHDMWRDPTKHIEGRIAYLRTELKITDAQRPQWDAVAAVLRANAQKMEAVFAKREADRDKPHTVLDRLQHDVEMSQAHAQATTELLAAAKPLYASLSDDQKKVADELLAHRPHI